MGQLSTIPLTVAFLVTTFSISHSIQAQVSERPAVEGSQPTDTDESAPTVAEVQAAIDALDADESLDESIKTALKQKYEQALTALQSASDLATLGQEYSSAIQSGPTNVEQLQADLAGLDSADSADVRGSGTAEEIQREIDARKVANELLRKQLEDSAAQLSRLERRPVEIPARLLEIRRELSDIRERLESPELASTEPGVSASAERMLLQARVVQLVNEQETLQQEQLSQSIRLDLLKAQQSLLERQITVGQSVLERLNTELQLLVSNMAERIRRVANSVPAELSERNPTVESLVAEVRALADELEATIRQEERFETLQNEARLARENLDAEFSSLQEQLEINSNGGALVQLLFNLDRRCLQAIRELRRNPVSGLEDARLGSLAVREDLRAQPEIEASLGKELSTQVQELLAVRREAVEELGRRFTDLTRTLAAADQERQEYLERAKQVRESIDETLFGFGLRSCPPISVNTFLSLPQALRWSFQPAHGKELAEALLAVSRGSPLVTLAMVLLVATLFLVRPRLVASLEATGARNKRLSKDRYRNTCEAIGWTFLLALPIPLTIGFIGWALGQTAATSDWFAGVRAGILRTSWVVLATALMLAVTRPRGLGNLHFGWSEARLSQIRRAVFLTTVIYVPALAVTVSCTYGDASAYLRSLGRVSFLVAHLWAMFQVVLLFINTHEIVGRTVEGESEAGNEIRQASVKWRWLGFGLLFTALLSIVVMIVVGYVITSLIWSLGVVVTLVMIGAGRVLHSLALRWFSIEQRRRAFEEALQQRRARGEIQVEDGPTEIVETDAEEESEFTLEMVGAQTRQLLRSFFNIAVLFAVLAFWSKVLPLGDLVGSVTLPIFGGLTLRALLLAFLVVVVSFVVVKNLPGLLESIVFRSNNVQPGTRLAIYTLCQYVAIAIGIVVFADVVQVDWAQFGWIVTALSVGIGFGLQEVVANFVSGIILLLERPIRVGDIVTVESMTGTVKKIHLRATTITNWDRQEFVVPNKTLITNTILNWTLSAPLNRIVIPVGVAYGSDTEHAREILLAVAEAHPNVLADPAPMATFEQFADSSLNMVLRAYLPDLDARLSTISELHTEIHKRFATAGIEIAFPQQDLHLRSGWKEALGSQNHSNQADS